mmetsp:Transcript_3903/g.11292  ORF Transcript_3903/g.11292 Transcript_3903/m.11292 type:complete len:335 (+) Transcript_3903:155-1159(+)
MGRGRYSPNATPVLLAACSMYILPAILATAGCPNPPSEQILNGITAGLFRERLMPPGATFDVGCKLGKWACFYAKLDSSRAVIAMDPDLRNTQRVRKAYGRSYPNIIAVTAFLGRRETLLSAAEIRKNSATASDGSDAVRMRNIDALFRNRTLGFAHIDVESNELDALMGGISTFRRDKPIISVEVHVHFNRTLTQAILNLLAEEDYLTQLVQEDCGARRDGRNIIAFPKTRVAMLAQSPTLLMAAASGVLFSVDSQSIFQYAPPCCEFGGACCLGVKPMPLAQAMKTHCCRRSAVERYAASNPKAASQSMHMRQIPPWSTAARMSWPGRARGL